MLNRFRNALYNAVSGIDGFPTPGRDDGAASDNRLPLKFPYSRPDFLQLSTEDEVLVTADHAIRPIIVPRDINKLPWKAGYAEAINAGKSVRNEDQASIHIGTLRLKPESLSSPSNVKNGPEHSLPYVYFAVFDGHAGTGAAVSAYNTLHEILHVKLSSVLDQLLEIPRPQEKEVPVNPKISILFPEKEVTPETLVIGALESAFWDMDQIIANERMKFRITGGCTVLVALFILGKLFVANAGDSRGTICRSGVPVPMSHDFTPESERTRIRNLALIQPALLGGDYTALEFSRRPSRRDIGKRLLYRETYMTGWAYKTVTEDDLRFPLVCGEGKRSRVLATIGVTRGFGDHDLKAQVGHVNIKPFLTPQPEVKVFDIKNENLTYDDVLVMGTDGLWDISSNEMVAEIVQKSLEAFPETDEKRFRYRYTTAAQDLVMQSRGKLKDRGWKTTEGRTATIDDITVFVIPLLMYKEEYFKWREAKRVFMEASSTSVPTPQVNLVAQNTNQITEQPKSPIAEIFPIKLIETPAQAENKNILDSPAVILSDLPPGDQQQNPLIVPVNSEAVSSRKDYDEKTSHPVVAENGTKTVINPSVDGGPNCEIESSFSSLDINNTEELDKDLKVNNEFSVSPKVTETSVLESEDANISSAENINKNLVLSGMKEENEANGNLSTEDSAAMDNTSLKKDFKND